MFGGSDARSVEMIPQDIRITRNLFSKPLHWKDLAHQPSIKCLLEIKNVIRLHIASNVFDGNWSRAWPSVRGVVFKASPAAAHTECQDVLVNNVIRNCGAAFSIVGSRDGGEPSGRMTNVTIHNNLAYNICEGDDYTGDGRHVPIANPPIALHITHNSVTHGWCHSFMNWWWDEVQETGEDLVMTDNCAHHGEYGIHSSDGRARRRSTLAGRAIPRHRQRAEAASGPDGDAARGQRGDPGGGLRRELRPRSQRAGRDGGRKRRHHRRRADRGRY